MKQRAQAFTTSYNGRSLVLRNDVFVGPAFDPAAISGPINPTTAKGREFTAIWDTGATHSCITEGVATACNLKPTSIVQTHSAQGTNLANAYYVSLFLPNNVFFPGVNVTQVRLRDADVLIGMDIISQGDFAVTNLDGKTKFSFRMPSLTDIDFVQQASSQGPSAPKGPFGKVGRNAPCPCGSGKKYKNCHGK